MTAHTTVLAAVSLPDLHAPTPLLHCYGLWTTQFYSNTRHTVTAGLLSETYHQQLWELSDGSLTGYGEIARFIEILLGRLDSADQT